MATIKQQKAFKEVGVNGGNISKAMKAAGYGKEVSKRTDKLTKTKGWKELMEKHLPDSLLGKKHKELLESRKLEHMTFPPLREPKEADEELSDDMDEESLGEVVDVGGEQISDEDIKDMLASVNCVVRKIVHGEMARHVYFWAKDNRSVKEALDMAYKLKGKYAPEKTVNLNIDTEISNPEAMALAKEYEEKLKKGL